MTITTQSTLLYPPTDGTVTLPDVLDFHNERQPNRAMYTFVENGATDMTKISFFEFRRASDRFAHFIRPGRGGSDGEVVAMVALSDTLLYQAGSMGLIRADNQPYMMSPRNTASAIIKMLKETECHKILTTQQTLKALISEVKLALDSEEYPLEIIEMPPLANIFPRMGHEVAEDPFDEYPRPATPRMLDETLMYLHSSGSTGMPKTIGQRIRTICNWAALPGISEACERRVGCMALPAFHTLGFAVQILRSTYSLCIIALYPPIADTPAKLPIMPSPDNIIDHMQRNECEDLISIPAMFTVWAQNDKTVEYLASLKLVIFSGGPLPSEIGQRLVNAGVKLSSVYGGTEFGAPTHVTRHPTSGDHPWEWMSFSESINTRFEPQSDGTYEVQFLRHPTRHDLPVENMVGVRGYATSDLFIPHPSEPNFWKLVGRKDDVIIHSSGEKTVPAPIENIIAQSPYVTGVIMFGHQHDQPGVLIELQDTYAIDTSNLDEVSQARMLIWPIVEQANKVAPAFSRIFKEFILFSDPQKPLLRSGKGTIMRKATLTQYQDEIEALYTMVASTAGSTDIVAPMGWLEKEVCEWISNQLVDILPDIRIIPDEDLFDQGMDSLSATVLRRRIFHALKSDPTTTSMADKVTQNTVYAHPTTNGLAAFIASVATSGSKHSELPSANRIVPIEQMLLKYSQGLETEIARNNALPLLHCVLITGTTGNLGSQILESLLRQPDVEKIYALNRRSGNALEKHKKRFQDKGFDTKLLQLEKLAFLEGDTAESGLSLSEDTYKEIKNSVTVIIHNAWRLDFNLSLASFESNIRGTRHLIDLGRSTPFGADVRFIFTSSVSQAYSWDTRKGPYPEEIIADAQYAVGMGYGESKYVSEKIIARSGLRATSLRIGQITGGWPNGAWAISDWVPIMVRSSISLGALPSQLGNASWIPMNDVAGALLDIAFSINSTGPALNIVHPRPIAFDSIMSLINEALVTTDIIKSRLPVLSQEKWSALLGSHALSASDHEVERVPALKLLDFFRASAKSDSAIRSGTLKGIESGGLTAFSTGKSVMFSKTMKNLGSLGEYHAESWVKYWKDAGLFDNVEFASN